MSKQEAKRTAQEFVLKYKHAYGAASDNDIKAAVQKVARALVSMAPPQKKSDSMQPANPASSKSYS